MYSYLTTPPYKSISVKLNQSREIMLETVKLKRFLLCPTQTCSNVKSKVKQSCHATPCGRQMLETVQPPLILDHGKRWRECSALHPGRALHPRLDIHGTHWIGGWAGLRAGLGAEARGKILCLCRGSNPGTPVVQSVIRHNTAVGTLPWSVVKDVSTFFSDWSIATNSLFDTFLTSTVSKESRA
jgi:hypothetical protein